MVVGNGKLFEWVKEDGRDDKHLVFHRENVSTLWEINWTVLFLTIAIILILISYKPMMDSCQRVVDNACDYCDPGKACNVCFSKTVTGSVDNVVPVLGVGGLNGKS